MKPDNILVNWTCDEQGNATVTNVALGDFDIAYKSENGEPRQTPYAIGNAMWRSPEGQTGMGVTKASDMFSFGLVVSMSRQLEGVGLRSVFSAYMPSGAENSCF